MPGAIGAPGLLDELAGPERPLSLIESARVLGGLRWLELEGYARLGRASVAGNPDGGGDGGADPRLTVWAASSSRAHAWRAEQLLVLLPVSVGLPGAEECTRSPGAAVEAFAASLGDLVPVGAPAAAAGSGSGGVDRASAWYGLLAAAYDRRATFVHVSADPPTVRVLGRLAADVRAIVAAAVPVAPSPGGIA